MVVLIDIEVEQANGLFASFNATPNSGTSPVTATFTDTSYTDDPLGVLSWAWDFDNGGIIDWTNSTVTVVGAVNVDQVEASFTVGLLAPGVWQFTNTSTPTPISWAAG